MRSCWPDARVKTRRGTGDAVKCEAGLPVLSGRVQKPARCCPSASGIPTASASPLFAGALGLPPPDAPTAWPRNSVAALPTVLNAPLWKSRVSTDRFCSRGMFSEANSLQDKVNGGTRVEGPGRGAQRARQQRRRTQDRTQVGSGNQRSYRSHGLPNGPPTALRRPCLVFPPRFPLDTQQPIRYIMCL